MCYFAVPRCDTENQIIAAAQAATAAFPTIERVDGVFNIENLSHREGGSFDDSKLGFGLRE